MKAALLLVAAAIAGATGCSTNDVSLSILQMQAVTRLNMCVALATGGASTMTRNRGTLDVSLVTSAGYIAVPIVRNNLPSNLNGVEYNSIQLTGANVKLSNVDGTTLTLANGQSSFFYASAGGRLDPGGTAAMFVEVLPAPAAQSLAGMIPTTAPGVFSIVAEVKPVGMHASDQVVGGPIDFPIDLCNGCLVDVMSDCPLAKGTIVSIPCFPAQDESTTCCKDTNGALLCDAAAPIAM
jgi:hypothetical protein